MSEIDRRALFGAMGAGLVLTGCKPDKNKLPKRSDPTPDTCYTKGLSCPFGDPAEKVIDRPNVFFPEYLCVTYLQFKKGALKIRHGYIKLDGRDWSDAHVAMKARKVLIDLAKGPLETPLDALWVNPNFENYSMSTPSVMVFYLDNDESIVRFNEELTKENPDKPAIIRFTQFSAVPLHPGVKEIKPNHAFRNLVPLSGLPRRAYRLDFFNTDENDQPIVAYADKPNTWFVYSMNIHLQYAVDRGSGDTSYVPIIIDPDPGNMGSNP